MVILSSSQAPPAGFTALNQRIFVSTSSGYLAKKMNMTPARQAAGAAPLGNYIYIVGGTADPNGNPDNYSRLTQIYNPATNQWGPAANLQMDRVLPGVASNSSFVFAVGGSYQYGATNRAEMFNGSVWSYIPSLRVYRNGPAAAIHGNNLFAFGGSSQTNLAKPGAPLDATCEFWPVGSGNWLPLADLPTGIFAASAVTIGDLIYVIGGLTSDPNFVFSNFVFDLKTGKWKSIATPAPDLVWYTGLNIGGKLYALGGIRYQRGQPSGAIYEYQADANTWWQLTQFMSPARSNMAGAVFNNRGFIFGGGNVYLGSAVYPDTEEFLPIEANYYLMKKS